MVKAKVNRTLDGYANGPVISGNVEKVGVAPDPK